MLRKFLILTLCLMLSAVAFAGIKGNCGNACCAPLTEVTLSDADSVGCCCCKEGKGLNDPCSLIGEGEASTLAVVQNSGHGNYSSVQIDAIPADIHYLPQHKNFLRLATNSDPPPLGRILSKLQRFDC